MKTKLKKLLKLDATDISGIKNLLLKPLGMLLSIVYTPMLLGYLGDEKYGLWATVLSIISWVNYCDVGIGHGLRNLLVKQIADNELEEARKSVSTAYIVLTMIAAGILLVLLCMVFMLDWHTVFNTSIDMRLTLIISFGFICLNFVLALSNTLLYALQMAERVALRAFLTQVLNVAGLFVISRSCAPSLEIMAVLFGCTSMIIYGGNSIQLFRKYSYVKPSIHLFDRNKVRFICATGVKFFAIQISCLLLYTVDDVLITHYFGASEVTPFNVVNKAFNMGFSFLSALTVPYWSRTTEALSQGNVVWVRNAIKKVRAIFALFVVAYIVLAVLFKPLARLWMGRELIYQTGVISVMCVYYILFSFVTITTPFINGSGKINGQLILSVFMGIMNVPLSIFFSVQCGMGVVGVRFATMLLMLLGAIYYPIELERILRKAEKTVQNEPRK